MDGEVPWYDTNGDTKRSISDNNLFVIIFLNDLFLDVDLGQFANPVYTSLDLSDGELVLDKAYISKSQCLTDKRAYWLPLLLREQLAKIWNVLFKAISESQQSLLAVCHRDLGPRLESLFGSSYRVVDILLC